MFSCILFVLALTAFPTMMTVALERAYRAAWGIVTERYDDAGRGAYRGVRVARREPGRAPASVVAGAWTAFFLGQMIVPGVVVLTGSCMLMVEQASFAPIFVVTMLFGPTGIWLAGRQLATGRALLRRQFAAESMARRTAVFAFAQNGLLIAAVVAAAVLERGELDLAVLMVVCALLAIGQAFLLLRAARDFERHAEREWLPEAQVPQ